MRCAFLVRRYAILVRGLLTIALAVVLSGCPMPTGDSGKDDAAPITIATSDGRARLTVPPAALPEGVTPDDITIGEVSVDPDFFTAQEVQPPLAVFQLEPDGLQFSEPVTLIVELPVEDPSGRQVQVFLVAGDEVEFIPDVESEVDLETNTLTASIQLTHFSDVWVSFAENVFEVEVSASASEVLIGETFEVTFTVTRTVEPGKLLSSVGLPSSVTNFYLGHAAERPSGPRDDTWFLEGRIDVAFGPVRPSEVENVPPLTSMAGTQQTFTIPAQEFECFRRGTAKVGYEGTVRYHVAPVVGIFQDGFVGDAELEERPEKIEKLSETVQCVRPKIMAAAAPPFTTYTLSPGIPGGADFFAWSGANCGSVTGSTTSSMVWNHGEEGCEHAGEAHPDATISLLVTGTFPISGESYELRCNYTGAASGEGPECFLVGG